MTNPAISRLTAFGVVLQLCSILCFADEPQSLTPDAMFPELVECRIGDLGFQIDGPKRWTLSGIDYKNQSVATRDSAYGTVLNIEGVGLLGTAHFLDIPGRPGGVEKENVTGLQFIVDGAPVSSNVRQLHLAGQSFQMHRTSTIRSVQLQSRVSVHNDVLIETVRLQTNTETRLKICYPLMYAWSPEMTHYLFGDESGVQKRGQFLATDAPAAEGLERTARWMAVYDAAHQCGAVCRLQQQPASEDVWLQYTDAPDVYRKLRLMSFSEKTMPAGFDGTYQTAVGFFTAEKAAWEEAAVNTLTKLKGVTESKR